MSEKRWTAREVKLLGTKPDRVMAEQLGRTIWSVRTRRRKLGVARYIDVDEYRRWTAEEDGLLGTRPDKEVARQLARSLQAVHTRRFVLGIPPPRREQPWTEAEDNRLGTSSDA
jgi:hypothetical protein